jgi:ABC-type molybdate transport system substrate-binding protein
VIEDPNSADPLAAAFGSSAIQALANSGMTSAQILAAETLGTAASNGCIVLAPNLTAADNILRTGGSTVSGAIVGPAQYALISQAATTGPVSVDTNSFHDPIQDNGPLPIASTYTPVYLYANLVTPALSPNPAYTVQVARFVNYLLGPLGEATLQAYGFGPGFDSYNSTTQIGWPFSENNP